MRDSKRPFRYLVLGWLVIVLVVTTISILRPQPVLSDSDLTAAVNAAFLPRPEDPALHELAHQRALEASVNFSHTGMVTAEVLAWNSGMADPVGTVIRQWLESPAHLAILVDPSFVAIGCGSVTVNGAYYAACVLSRSSTNEPVPQPVEQPLAPQADTETMEPLASQAAIPDTALEAP